MGGTRLLQLIPILPPFIRLGVEAVEVAGAGEVGTDVFDGVLVIFHVGIARLSRNQMLIRAVHEARCQMERIMYAAIDIRYFGELPTREHRAIMKDIVEHNPDAARRHMHDHIVQSKSKVLRLTVSPGGR